MWILQILAQDPARVQNRRHALFAQLEARDVGGRRTIKREDDIDVCHELGRSYSTETDPAAALAAAKRIMGGVVEERAGKTFFIFSSDVGKKTPTTQVIASVMKAAFEATHSAPQARQELLDYFGDLPSHLVSPFPHWITQVGMTSSELGVSLIQNATAAGLYSSLKAVQDGSSLFNEDKTKFDSVVQGLANIVLHGKDPQMVMAAAIGLGRLNSIVDEGIMPKARTALQDVLRDDTDPGRANAAVGNDPNVRCAIIWALSEGPAHLAAYPSVHAVPAPDGSLVTALDETQPAVPALDPQNYRQLVAGLIHSSGMYETLKDLKLPAGPNLPDYPPLEGPLLNYAKKLADYLNNPANRAATSDSLREEAAGARCSQASQAAQILIDLVQKLKHGQTQDSRKLADALFELLSRDFIQHDGISQGVREQYTGKDETIGGVNAGAVQAGLPRYVPFHPEFNPTWFTPGEGSLVEVSERWSGLTDDQRRQYNTEYVTSLAELQRFPGQELYTSDQLRQIGKHFEDLLGNSIDFPGWITDKNLFRKLLEEGDLVDAFKLITPDHPWKQHMATYGAGSVNYRYLQPLFEMDFCVENPRLLEQKAAANAFGMAWVFLPASLTAAVGQVKEIERDTPYLYDLVSDTTAPGSTKETSTTRTSIGAEAKGLLLTPLRLNSKDWKDKTLDALAGTLNVDLKSQSVIKGDYTKYRLGLSSQGATFLNASDAPVFWGTELDVSPQERPIANIEVGGSPVNPTWIGMKAVQGSINLTTGRYHELSGRVVVMPKSMLPNLDVQGSVGLNTGLVGPLPPGVSDITLALRYGVQLGQQTGAIVAQYAYAPPIAELLKSPQNSVGLTLIWNLNMTPYIFGSP